VGALSAATAAPNEASIMALAHTNIVPVRVFFIILSISLLHFFTSPNGLSPAPCRTKKA